MNYYITCITEFKSYLANTVSPAKVYGVLGLMPKISCWKYVSSCKTQHIKTETNIITHNALSKTYEATAFNDSSHNELSRRLHNTTTMMTFSVCFTIIRIIMFQWRINQINLFIKIISLYIMNNNNPTQSILILNEPKILYYNLIILFLGI